jgi:hypothetical protein
MRPAIFVVGPDGSGKTETSTEIARLTGMPRFKCPSEKEWFKEGSFVNYLGFDLMLPHFIGQTLGNGFVSDRGYPCEWVYSKAFGRQTDDSILEEIDRLWSNRGGRIVVLTRRDYTDITDDLVETKMLPVIHGLYQEFRFQTRLPCISICTDDHSDVRHDWATSVAEEIILWTARELQQPKNEIESVLYYLCKKTRVDITSVWKDGPHKSIAEMNRWFDQLALGYLYLTSGAYERVLDTLDGMNRDDLPRYFWDRLEALV